ncbi:hypothetical protein Tco_1440119 [Tanacetum coccineum]
MGLWYPKDSGFELITYSDADHVRCKDDCKVTSEDLQFLGGKLVSWCSKKQDCTAMSTAEAEYEDGSKYRLKFMLDKKELSLTLDDFRTIFHLPHANDNNRNSFVPPPSFSDMVPFYKQQLGFTMELKTSSSFKTTGLLALWQTLCKIFSKCLTTRVTGWDQPPLQIMQMMFWFVNNIYVDYAELLRSTRLTPPALVPTIDKADEMILQDTLQIKSKARENGRYTYLFGHLKERFLSRKSFDTLADHLQEVMVESLPTMVDTHIKEQVKKQVPEQVRDQVPVYVAEGLILERQKTKEEMERMIAKAILQERGNIQAEISSQIQKAIDNQIPSQVDASVRSYMSGHILHVHPAQSQTLSVPEQQYQLYLSMKDNPQLQQQDIAIWLALQMKFERGESCKVQKTSGVLTGYVSGESSSGQVNEEERDDDEYEKQCHKIFMMEVSLTIDEAKLKKMADEMLRQRCTSGDKHQYHIDQIKNFLKNPEAPALSLINQDLLYLKKGSSGPEKIVCHFTSFLPQLFSMWMILKNELPDGKKQKEPGNQRRGLFKFKIIQGHKTFHDYAESSVAMKVNLTTPTISFPGVEKHKMFSIIYEPMHGIIYKNSKKEKRVMRNSEIHKFCDATLNKVLEGLKSYNNDVKYGYVQRELIADEVEYLKLFEEEIEVRLKNRNQMRRWEMYVNGRPLGPRRERP